MTVATQLAGKTGTCKACGARVTVPAPAPQEEEEVLLVEVRCPNRKCGRSIRVRAAYAGRTGKCPACATAVKVPELDGVPPPPPPPAVRQPASAPVAPPKREGDTDEIVLVDEYPHGKGREGPPTVQNLDDD